MNVWLLSITHRNGTQNTVCKTEAGAYAALAEYVSSQWDAELGGTLPKKEKDMVTKYFKKVDEYFDINQVPVSD